MRLEIILDLFTIFFKLKNKYSLKYLVIRFLTLLFVSLFILYVFINSHIGYTFFNSVLFLTFLVLQVHLYFAFKSMLEDYVYNDSIRLVLLYSLIIILIKITLLGYFNF